MIHGIINDHVEAVVRIRIRGPVGKERVIDAVLDTGFSGSLTLPKSIAMTLGLRRAGRGSALLANGKIEEFDVYEAWIDWDGQEKRVEVDAAEVESLLGMALLEGHDVRMRVLAGGEVAIQSVT
jgi:clan AA aspartic protease